MKDLPKKMDKEFFCEIQELDFGSFMELYYQMHQETGALLEKSMNAAKNNKRFSMNLNYNLRQKTVALHKFGLEFRARTIKMSKSQERNRLNYDV